MELVDRRLHTLITHSSPAILKQMHLVGRVEINNYSDYNHPPSLVRCTRRWTPESGYRGHERAAAIDPTIDGVPWVVWEGMLLGGWRGESENTTGRIQTPSLFSERSSNRRGGGDVPDRVRQTSGVER